MQIHNIILDGNSLNVSQVWHVANGNAKLNIDPKAENQLNDIRQLVEKAANQDQPIYGINTGFGALAENKIPKDQLEKLQHNLILSHAVGVGEPLTFLEARALMLLRTNTLIKGHSGCRAIIIQNLIKLLNADCAPYVPKKGSVGASGDLAPLAHLALLLIGEGKGFIKGKQVQAKTILKYAGVKPLILKAKEGLALINGTQAMAALGCIHLFHALRLCDLADMIGAMSVDALKGSDIPFDDRIHQTRPHPGQIYSAQNLRILLEKSEIRKDHANCKRVQDAYSIRCMPQVHGATRDTLAFVQTVLEREINSATDNPLVFKKNDNEIELLSGGNFHGQPIAFALDFLAIATAELANISERRIEQMLNPVLSTGLPAFLAPSPGINSGFMIMQVTAAALVNENKIFCHPASTDSISTSASREDHVSMGMTSANKATTIIDNCYHVLSIELMTAAQAIEFRKPLKPGNGAQIVIKRLRNQIAFAKQDRAFGQDMQIIYDLCRNGHFDDVLPILNGKSPDLWSNHTETEPPLPYLPAQF